MTENQRRVLVLALASLTLGLAGCAVTPGATETVSRLAELDPVGHAEFRMSGAWSGELDTEGQGILSVQVDAAGVDGTSFDGEITIQSGEEPTTERAHAELTPNGHLVIRVGSETTVEAHITDPDTLDYCLAVYGTEPLYTCGRLLRLE